MAHPIALVFLAALLGAVSAYQLTVLSNDSCSAYGNGTCFNIRNILPFPVAFAGPGEPEYKYWWHPCGPVPCPGRENEDVAVCQLADVYWATGLNPAVWYWNGVRGIPTAGASAPGPYNLNNGSGNSSAYVVPTEDYVAPQSPAELRLVYNNGDTWRNTIVTITQQANATVPVVLFLSESPYLQYNIQVYVADIGYTPDFCGPARGGPPPLTSPAQVSGPVVTVE